MSGFAAKKRECPRYVPRVKVTGTRSHTLGNPRRRRVPERVPSLPPEPEKKGMTKENFGRLLVIGWTLAIGGCLLSGPFVSSVRPPVVEGIGLGLWVSGMLAITYAEMRKPGA